MSDARELLRKLVELDEHARTHGYSGYAKGSPHDKAWQRARAFLAAEPQPVFPAPTMALGPHESAQLASISKFLNAEPQQDNDAGVHEAGRDDVSTAQQSGEDEGSASIRGHRLDRQIGPASPIQPGEVAALIERLRAWHLNEPPQFRHWASIWNDMRHAADMLARLSKT